MIQRPKLDARKVDPNTKKASLLGDSLSDEEKEKLIGEQPQLPEEDDKLTPVKPLPGTPKGMQGEVVEEYTPMSAAEIAEKRKEQEKAAPTVEEDKPAFRDVMKDLLKSETPEGKKEQAQQAKYGPPEKIQETVDTLKEFHEVPLRDIDIEQAQAIINRADLPEILKERAQMLFDSRSRGDLARTEQLALTSLNAIMPKAVKEATEWLQNTSEGQSYMNKVFDKYRIGRVMSMLENTVLMMAGQHVIDQPRGMGISPEQRTEKRRLEQLGEALQGGTITDAEFADAKRKGWTLQQLMKEKNKGKAFRLNMRKDAEGNTPNTTDTTGPGGDAWEYEWTSGPSPTKDNPQKRKHRFPFHNKPSGYTPGEGDQGNLHDIGPMGGQSDMNYLSNIIKSMNKTADNALFSTYSFDKDESWLTYTLFKKAYSKFRPGDIVVQYGKTTLDCQTYRRRFGSVAKAKKSLVDTLSPILAATLPMKPTPDDSLHDLQKGKGEPGGSYGPHTNPYDKQPEQGNRDGFDAKNPPRQRIKRKFIPFMDQPNDEASGFPGGGGTMGSSNKRAQTNQVSQMSLPELLNAHKPGGMFGTIWGEPCKARFTELTGKKWSPEIVNEYQKMAKKLAGFAAPIVETPEERAGTIEQPPIKPINKDVKRPLKPKKRYDTNEQNLTDTPNYMGEDSTGFDKERIRLSMRTLIKKLSLNMKKGAVPTYEMLQKGLASGQINQEEFDQMVEYYQLAPPTPVTQTIVPEETLNVQDVSEWDPNKGQVQVPEERGKLFFGKRKIRFFMKKTSVNPKYTNILTEIYFDTLASDPSHPDEDDAVRATTAAVDTLLTKYPEINKERLAQVAEEADRLMGSYPTSFANVVRRY